MVCVVLSFSGSVTLCDRNIQMSSHFKVENLWLESSVYHPHLLWVSLPSTETGRRCCGCVWPWKGWLYFWKDREFHELQVKSIVTWSAGWVGAAAKLTHSLKDWLFSSSEAQEPSVLPRWMLQLWIPKECPCTFVRVSWSSEAKSYSPTSLQIDLYQNGFSPFECTLSISWVSYFIMVLFWSCANRIVFRGGWGDFQNGSRITGRSLFFSPLTSFQLVLLFFSRGL